MGDRSGDAADGPKSHYWCQNRVFLTGLAHHSPTKPRFFTASPAPSEKGFDARLGITPDALTSCGCSHESPLELGKQLGIQTAKGMGNRPVRHQGSVGGLHHRYGRQLAA